MRVVACQTGKRAATFLKALTLLEIRRLMTNVPRIIPNYCSQIPFRETMARSARSIQFASCQCFRVLNQLSRLRQIAAADRLHMGVTRSVTDFAAHAGFGNLDFTVCRYRHGASRMALETVLNRTARTLDLESLAHCLVQCFCRETFVLWRDIEGLRI